ncbi:MAG TPA: TonB-dependent receptor [Candidatus Polarisedimenticolia bacterium]|jgi:hypothetical protein|nr:TonB-dependent receptor [Candidatus Polarisedimenticolia bacterium]
MRVWVAVVALAISALFVPAFLYGQETTSGTISGRVTDPTGKPIAGAIIIAQSDSGPRTATTDADGNYVLPFLRPGTYNVRAEAPSGFNTGLREGVIVGLNQRVSVDFGLTPGKVEEVTVTGTPLVDATSTASGTNIRYDEFANSVPLGRSFTDTYSVASGVVSGRGTGQGNYSISGASGLENAYLIDGVNVTNTGYGGIGAYNIVYGSLGTGVTSEFLEEVQIKTGGFEAEYGQALGGIINTIVKSGTNDFKGSVAWYATPQATRSDYTLAELQSGAANTTQEGVNDFAFQVGGPIVKDKLFYFFAYNPVITTTTREAQFLTNPAFGAAQAGVTVFDETDPTGFGVPSALAFPSAGQGLERRRQANNYAAKFTFQMTDNQQLELTAFGDPAAGDMGPQRDLAPLFGDFQNGGGESSVRYGSNNIALKWNGVITPKFFMEGILASHDGYFRESPGLDQYRYIDYRDNLEFRRGATTYTDPALGAQPFAPAPVLPTQGGVGFITSQDDKQAQAILKLTNTFASHELRYGLEYDKIRYRENASYTGPSFNIELPVSFFDATTATISPVDSDGDGNQDFLPVASRGGAVVQVRNGTGDPTVAFDSANTFRVTRARMGPNLPYTDANEWNAFAQDTWSITSRVTLKAGIRYTEESIDGGGEFTLPFATENVEQDIGGGNTVASRIFTPGTSTYTPNSYTFAGNWAPRIGVSWDVLGSGKSRLYANFARYFQRVPSDLAVRAFSNEVGISLQEFNDRTLATPRTAGTGGCVDLGGAATTTCATSFPVFTQGVDQTEVVGGVKLPYEDEISGGYAFELTGSSSLEVRAIFRTQGRVLEDTQVNAVEQIQNFYYGTAYGYPYDPFGGSPAAPNSAQFPARTFGTYELANPGTHQIPQGLAPGMTFPKPERTYKALEAIYTKRLDPHWSLFANYRLSRLEGNYEGLFRNDNGQSDPNITSLYDFPNSPLMQGQFIKGPLPSDATHVVHIFPSYIFESKLRLGANLSWSSGFPRTSMLAHPIYQNAGEVPGIDPIYSYWVDDGTGTLTLSSTNNLATALADPNAASNIFLSSYTPVKRGNLGRTPDLWTLDLHADYPIAIGKTSLSVMFDVFNVTDQDTVTNYNDNIELTAGVTDPDFLQPLTFQPPRTVRLAARWSF